MTFYDRIMMRNRFQIVFIFWFVCCVSMARQTTDIAIKKGEYWWGGATALGSKMPYILPLGEFNLANQNGNNQVSPLLVSSMGRYVWSDLPFRFSVSGDVIHIESDYEKVEVEQGGATLREAYLTASRKHFASNGKLPDELFFTMPQYNTWIELMYNQNQEDIMAYARNIVRNDFPVGIIMIDDNWQRYYGNFDFKPDRFPNPRGMVDELHRMGFKVMLWVSPFVTADSPEYRELAARKLLLRDASGEPAIIRWWNGQSACFDFTNPEAKAYFIARLREMQQTYGIDGFKFDGGDNNFYDRPDLMPHQKGSISVDHTRAWAEIGCEFAFNEYRAGWQMGCRELVQRLGDKDYSWDAVRLLIPDMIAAGLLGYTYTCPDMIGGGSFLTFMDVDADKFDQRLIVRSAAVHALMPMMQFSVAPWRILNKDNLDIVRRMAKLHVRFGNYIMACAKEAAITGEPIVRNMEYAFPHQGYALIKDQFMLGDKYLVAPVVDDKDVRDVVLPKGKWKDEEGKVYKGGRTITIDAPLGRLPYFERM